MATDALLDYLDAACEAARRGAAVLEDWRSRFQVREKARHDLVTEADLASQQAIRAYLHERFPTHGFLGEEDPSHQAKPAADAPPLWIVDPLDGTTNYVHDCPMYCVSIGLWANGAMVAGVVFDPRQNELFSAAKGHGAFLNGKRLRTSRAASFSEALLSTGFPPDMAGQERALAWWRYFSLRTQSLRRTGSTALNLAYVAAGRFDGYWAFDNHVWDVAGGVMLVAEAGGQLSSIDGGPCDPFDPAMLASNGPLHDTLVNALRTGP
jgi:myo-inositol-1(or 4)-monophosphatase